MDFLICQTSAASPAEPGELLFWFSISPEQNADIELLSCRELLAASKMLLERAGSKRKPTGVQD
jgi:hypothetical protein